PVLSGEYNGAFAVVTALLKEIKVLDPYTVEVHLTAPYYGALHDFTKLTPLAMMSPNAFTDDDTISEQILTATMGTGPYMSTGQSDGSSFNFVQNPNYHGEKPDVTQFRVKVISDNQTKDLALRSGEIDLIFGWDKISYDGFKEFSVDKKYETKASNENGMTRFIGFNAAKAPFNDRQVRLAVSHAIDKTSICDNLFYGIESKADTLLNRNLPYCDVAVEPYPYDLEKAKKILEEAGWRDTDGDGIREKDGQELAGEILYSSGFGTDDDLILTISTALKKLGIDIKGKGLEKMTRYAEVQQGNFTLSYSITYAIHNTPFTLINNMNSEMLVDNLMAQGLAHVPDGNELIMGLNTMVDQQEIQQTYAYILGEIHHNVSFVPISHIRELVVFEAEKIADYQFHGQPGQVNIAGIKLR
ncbi:MAG: ABC transporter substrate-binding protein, partial [Halanaerobiales bacterium]|nr:ABC transporter substrate-binding protein [Halanaerobiales bacterium]